MDAKYRIDTQENKRFMKDMTQSLLEFGKHFASPAGSAYYLGDDGTPWADRPRETWITCRMAHVYSMGCMLGYPDSDKLVGKALKGLTGELRDKEFGGWYSGITSDGKILPNKQCYAHAFVILAASSATLAGKSEAKNCYRMLWMSMTFDSGMKKRDFPVILGIRNSQSLILTEESMQICIL